jgi:hypothetical protein
MSQPSTSTTKPGRGGARPGAGRKRKPATKAQAGLRLEQDLREFVEAEGKRLGLKNGATIRHIIRQAEIASRII